MTTRTTPNTEHYSASIPVLNFAFFSCGIARYLTVSNVPNLSKGEWARIVGHPKPGVAFGGDLRTQLERDFSEVAVS